MPPPQQPRFVRVYYASRFRRQALIRWIAATFDGVWLGLLDAPRLGQLDAEFYRNTREPVGDEQVGYEDERFVRRGLESWEADVLRDHFPERGSILVTGAGSGREVLALIERGFDAVGYEPNPRLVAAALRVLPGRDGSEPVLQSERSQFPQQVPPQDAIIVGWGSYMLMPGRATRVQFLRDAAAHLRPGAPILVSTWLREQDAEAHLRRVARIGSLVRRLRGAPPLEHGDSLATNFVHQFSLDELEDEVRAGGLRVVAAGADPYGWVVGRRPERGVEP